MKKVVIISVVLLSWMVSSAQSDSLKVEQYCQLIATQKLFSNKVTIDIDFGEEKSIWQDNRLKNDNGTIKKFNTIIDAMNYMGKQGWIFINAYPVRFGDIDRYHFGFKKQFAKAAVQN